MAMTEHVEAVRAFNRFYTARMGLTRGPYARPLPEIRVMYELAHGTEEVMELKQALDIDAGQLSRVLVKLESQGLVIKGPSPLDARRQLARLTEAGKERFAAMDKDSADAIGAVLDGLGDGAAVVDADGAAQARDRAGRHAHAARVRARRPRLDGATPRRAVRPRVRLGPELRAPRGPHRRRLQPDARTAPGSRRSTANPCGAIMCVRLDEHHGASCAPCSSSRKRAASASATRLVDEVSATPGASGYTTLKLWTNDILHAADPDLRARAASRSSSEAPHHAFGQDDLVEQTWSLTLKPWTATS